MITNDFTPTMSLEELQAGEERHTATIPSRRLAMTAGLTKSSKELAEAWDKNGELYLVTLRAAVAAYEENKHLEDLLVNSITRLVSVVDDESSPLVGKAMQIISESINTEPS